MAFPAPVQAVTSPLPQAGLAGFWSGTRGGLGPVQPSVRLGRHWRETLFHRSVTRSVFF